MTVSILDRFLLVLFSLLGIAASVAFGALAWANYGSASSWENVIRSYPGYIYVTVVAAVLLLLSLRFLFYRAFHSTVDYVELQGAYGLVRISHDTLEQLSDKTGKSIRGVHDFATRIRQVSDGVILYTKVRALPDVELQALSEQVQTSVKDYVERIAGVRVAAVSVNIVQVAGQSAKGAKAWVD
jgi:uncharacterized alkaline shock family protein YloU